MAGWLTPVRKLGRPLAWRVRRARLVTSRARFFWGEVARPGKARRYTLATGSEQILIRHANREDSFVLDEIFGRLHTYAIPPTIAEAFGPDGPKVIMDVGGNTGLACLWFARQFPGASFTIVEADPTNTKTLEDVLELNQLTGHAEVIAAAAGTHVGSLEFIGGLGARSHAVHDSEAATMSVPMIDVIPLLDRVDVLKMDIEGGEWPILQDPRLRAASFRALCLEYHLWNCPEPDPTTAVRSLLANAGFRILELREEGHGGIVWALRQDHPVV
jgi:FkbM family methyltransferase